MEGRGVSSKERLVQEKGKNSGEEKFFKLGRAGPFERKKGEEGGERKEENDE